MKVLYATLPHRDYAALIRKVIYRNISAKPVRFTVVDGLPVFFPHVYAVEWTADSISFSADGHIYNTVDKATWVNGNAAYNGGPAPFNAPFHIVLNLAVGGQYDNNLLPPDSFSSATMDVDYVRIYQK